MRKILLIIIAFTLSITASYAADDDSTPYNPYPEPQTQTQPQTPPKPEPKKTQVKKKPAKKAAPKKRTSKRTKTPAKVSAPKPSLLEQAIALMEQGNYETAKRYLLRAINLNRRDPNVWYWYGKYHEYTGNFYQAQFFYSKAVKLDPSFEKLSRVVYYPNDPDKTPLWDPKRPARVYPVETSGRGVTTMTPDAIDRVTYPTAPSDPELPKVPVYTPPEPGSSPLNGDEWAPSVYVPPSHEDADSQARPAPVYVNNIFPEGSTIYHEVTEIERVNQGNPEQSGSTRESIVRADLPLYTPPEPGQKVTPVKNTKTQQVRKSEPVKKKQPAKKDNVKKQNVNKNKNTKNDKKDEKTPPARKTVRRQQTPSRTRTQTQPQTQPEQPRTPETRRVQPEQPREPQIQTPPVQTR